MIGLLKSIKLGSYRHKNWNVKYVFCFGNYNSKYNDNSKCNKLVSEYNKSGNMESENSGKMENMENNIKIEYIEDKNFNNNYNRNYNKNYNRNYNNKNYKWDKNNNNNNNKYNNNNYNKWDTTKKSHFINIPIEDTTFLQNYSILCEELKSTTLKDFHCELLQKPGKIHMTVCVLDLGEDQDKISKVHNILQEINPTITNIADGIINFNFHKFESMNEIESTRVIYASMVIDEYFEKLSEIIHCIIKALVDENIIERSSLKDSHINYDKKTQRYKIKLHMTLLNVLFLNKILKKERKGIVKSIDSAEILEFMNERKLPSSQITQVNFSRMREDKKIGKYELLYSYPLC